MGVGNYTEDDIKECARAFTGWRVVNPEYMSIKMRNNTARPYGYMAWQFEYDDGDHDQGEKTLLGETGELERRGRRGHHLQAGGHGKVPLQTPLPLLRGRRAPGAPVAPRAAARPRRHRDDDQGLFRLRLQRQGHAGGHLQVRIFHGRVGPLRQDQEPRRDGGRHPAPGRSHRAPVRGDLLRPGHMREHGPGPAPAAQRRGMAGRSGVDKHGRLRRADQLRRQNPERPRQGRCEGHYR